MKSGTWSYYGKAVREAVERVAEGLDGALDLEALAAGAALSPFHFHRIFRGMVGETPLQLHRRLRLERAAWTLLHGDASVTTIALDAGYDTHESFTRAFTERYGRSPSEFRAEGRSSGRDGDDRARIELPASCGIHFVPHRTPLGDPGTGGLGTGDFGLGDFEPAGGSASLEVRVEELPELHLASVRSVGPYHLIAQAFRRLLALVGEARLYRPDTMVMVIYHDDPETTPEAELRADAAVTVPAGTELPQGLEATYLRGGRYARATHRGPYAGLGDAWARFMGEWLPRSGERITDGAPFEVYRNDPAQVPEEEIWTDLFVPLTTRPGDPT